MVRRRPRPQSTAAEFSLNSDELWGDVDSSGDEEDLKAGNPDAIRASISGLSVMEVL
jgi:hypothetical protein